MKHLQHPITISSALVLALLVLGETLSPGFASLQQLQSLLIVSALLGIVAAGQNLVILGGREGIDLSVGGVISISALIGGNIMDGSNAGILPALIACLGTGAFFGLLNGLGVTILRIPPLVMTLGMLGVLEGLLVVVRQGIPSGRAAPMLAEFVSKPQLLWLPGIIWLWISIGLLMFYLLNKTVLGMRFFSIGANEPVARNVGVRVRWTRVRLYIFAGMFSAVTGLCILGYSGSSFANVGQQYMLASIIAVVLGGTQLAGGRGGYTGTMVGAVMLVVLQSILTTLNIEEAGRQFIFGATLLSLLFLYGREKNLRN